MYSFGGDRCGVTQDDLLIDLICLPNLGNFGGLFWLIFVPPGLSGARKSVPDGLTDLGTQNESSGARLRPIFDHFRQKCERFSNFGNLNFEKSACQGLYFLSINFLFI